jgi:hypothetical protein
MTDIAYASRDQRYLEPAVSWGAIFAGAFTAVAVGVTLTLVGAGLGYKLAYSGLASRDSLTTFTPLLGCGVIIVQVLSSALGGYLSGRLRTVWSSVHGDEAHFRDTAHGLIVWAVATVAGVLLAALVLGPYAASLSEPAAAAAVPSMANAERATSIAAQSSLFTAIGLVLSAFVAAVAARLGGMQAESMHGKV